MGNTAAQNLKNGGAVDPKIKKWAKAPGLN
jgi:hypothetical protein